MKKTLSDNSYTRPALSYKIKKSFSRDWDLYLLLLPGVIWFLMFCYKPMAGLRIAFYDYNIFRGIEGSTFVGLANFKEFLSGPDFLRTLKNTIMISVYQLLICFPFPIILAIAITEMKNKFVSKMTQTATFLPHFISVVVVCGLVVNFLSPSTGIVNIILKKLGMEPIYFMVKPEYFRGIYTIMTLWQNSGFNAIVYIAALMGIDPTLYEAAIVDGAGKWKRLCNVTIPSIMPTIVTMFVLQVGKMVKVGYEAILLLYKPTTYETADVIATYAYRIGISNRNYGLATAVGLFEALVALVMVVGANKISKKLTESTIW
ncbi:MAG: sugar ABC transporter permease [Spirochaetales bacterium]|mgnify:CR=1 FL=1|nr:sugar ABC transporter permease [Spirochaetales bacterium]